VKIQFINILLENNVILLTCHALVVVYGVSCCSCHAL